MPAITLKGLPTALHRALKRRAAEHKRSLNKEVIAVLEEAVAPARRLNVEALVDESQRFRAGLRFETTPEEIDTLKRKGRA